ncbi:hypothetical protein [Thalassoglobus polymorphus]|uniref:Uncharacterized protein n=1 Tax=Thalassoglobus polymorphus TaxID=2527994 RepID=A0A517QMZ7_9PLAN|nr:hypothetical protein [Thalassoglobus polymorphus]QDT32937.1 hypothetical protein Mal48_21860 [Thalassoglobus polymorphus]
MPKPIPQPVSEIRRGTVKAATWENETSVGVRHKVTISRIYKDGDEWRNTDSFGRDDLPLSAKVVDQAHSWIFESAVTCCPSPDTHQRQTEGNTYKLEAPPHGQEESITKETTGTRGS